MAEDEEAKAVAPAPDAPLDPVAAEASQPAASVVDPPVEVPATPGNPAAASTAEPSNKLHEWGAAVGIMMFLVVVLWFFLNFFRGTSL